MKIISRQDAAMMHMSRYFTGEPCVHGHVCERYVGDNKCVMCASSGNGKRTYSKFNQSPRAEAIAMGHKTYMSEKRCKYGHVGERYTVSGVCVECIRQSNKVKQMERKSSKDATGWSIYTNSLPKSKLNFAQYGELRAAHDSGCTIEMKHGNGKFVTVEHPFERNDGVYRVRKKTERDEFIEQCSRTLRSVDDSVLGALFDAGCRFVI